VHPGSATKVPVVLTASGDVVQIAVGTRRGCAVVKIEKAR
jgi:hypothetical protein